MSNRFKIYLLLALLVLIGLGIYSYQYQTSPKSVVQKEIAAVDNEAGKYLTDEFINRLKADAPSSTEYLDQSVSDYQVQKDVQDITTIKESDDSVKATIILKTTTINNKTGFSVITLDTYEAKLIKVSGQWKINDYKLINSETLNQSG
jgi:hypothetical protein